MNCIKSVKNGHIYQIQYVSKQINEISWRAEIKKARALKGTRKLKVYESLDFSGSGKKEAQILIEFNFVNPTLNHQCSIKTLIMVLWNLVVERP